MGKSQIMRFLIVDDEADLREILTLQLQALQVVMNGVKYVAEIHEAGDGKAGLAAVERMRFDVILTDINMPEMNGIEMLGAIRGSGNDVPVVMLTGYGDKQKSVEALRLGSYAFLDKPWKPDYLRRVMTGAAEQGIGIRSRAQVVDAMVATYDGVPEPRRRQLKNVFRSIFIGNDGLHRNDVYPIDTKKKAS